MDFSSGSQPLSQSEIDQNLKVDEEKEATKFFIEREEYLMGIVDKTTERMINALTETVNEMCKGCQEEGGAQKHHVLCKENIINTTMKLFEHMWNEMDIEEFNKQSTTKFKRHLQNKEQFSRDKNWFEYLKENFFIHYFRITE
uniref:Uncharacterized protein n=1 Tax=Clytia hemisphaerica TaxID=252671 RepID=A0A7M5VDY7_9CNID